MGLCSCARQNSNFSWLSSKLASVPSYDSSLHIRSRGALVKNKNRHVSNQRPRNSVDLGKIRAVFSDGRRQPVWQLRNQFVDPAHLNGRLDLFKSGIEMGHSR